MMRLIAQMPEENLLKIMAYLETSGIAAAFRKSQELIDSQALAEAHNAAMAAQEDLQKYRRCGTAEDAPDRIVEIARRNHDKIPAVASD